jgi:Zn-dependent peptidase ImmA (M78 family)
MLGGSSADMAELRALSTGLRVPLHLFAAKSASLERSEVLNPLFRDVRDANLTFDITVEKVAVFVEAALELLPVRNELPDWLQLFEIKSQTYVEADRISKIFRGFSDLTEDEPVNSLPTILGRMDGVVICRLNYSKYEGVSLIAGNYCFIFVSPRFQGRMLFTVAHELGHLIAHHKNRGPAVFETASKIGSFGRYSKEEAFVDAFASCLLLPDVGIGRSINAFREHYNIQSSVVSDFEILLLASFYGVSFQVAARRCEDLSLLPRGLGQQLFENIKRQFGSPEKRAQSLDVPPRQKIEFPTVSPALASAISEALNTGDSSIGWISDRLGLTLGEILSIGVKVDAT